MITKEQFKLFLGRYMFRRKANEEWISKVEAAFGSAWEAIYEHDYHGLFVDMLAELMGDTEEWIPYFIYEKDGEWFDVYFTDNEGTDQEECRIVHIDSYDKLFDLITGVYD